MWAFTYCAAHVQLPWHTKCCSVADDSLVDVWQASTVTVGLSVQHTCSRHSLFDPGMEDTALLDSDSLLHRSALSDRWQLQGGWGGAGPTALQPESNPGKPCRSDQACPLTTLPNTAAGAPLTCRKPGCLSLPGVASGLESATTIVLAQPWPVRSVPPVWAVLLAVSASAPKTCPAVLWVILGYAAFLQPPLRSVKPLPPPHRQHCFLKQHSCQYTLPYMPMPAIFSSSRFC